MHTRAPVPQNVPNTATSLTRHTEGRKHSTAETCEEGTSYYDDCNLCRCVNGITACTKRACLPKLVLKVKWCQDRGEGGWLDDCHWCTCKSEDTTTHACTRQQSCFDGSKEWPECSGNVSWLQDCNICRCTRDGKAACTKKLCLP